MKDVEVIMTLAPVIPVLIMMTRPMRVRSPKLWSPAAYARSR
jgi:hypothetical protein